MKTEIIKVDPVNPDKEIMNLAAAVIKKGGFVAFPTETVYGLGADYLNEKAIQRLYEVKDRPKGKPFTVHISNFDALIKLSCEVSPFAKHLIDRFWPGPLTLIFNTKSGEKIGVRMPCNKVAIEFISSCSNPIVAPSANISGKNPPRNAEDVLEDLNGRIDLLLNGGETEVGVESTVVDVSAFPYKVLREGAIYKSQIADVGKKAQV
jgi:L-threonylcarbamoyladenylate synthase